MQNNSKKIFSAIVVFLVFVVFFSYFSVVKNRTTLKAIDTKIVNISNSEAGSAEELKKLLRLAFPAKSAVITVSDASVSPYADANILVFSSYENDIPKFAPDGFSENYTETLILSSELTNTMGKLYIHQSRSAVHSFSLEVNNVVRQAKFLRREWYVVDDVPLTSEKKIVINSLDEIETAYLFLSQDQSLRASTDQVKISRFGLSTFDATMPEKSFVALAVPSEFNITSSEINSLLDQPIVAEFNSLSLSSAQTYKILDSSQNRLYIIKKTARYNLENTKPGLVSALITLLVIIAPFILILNRKIYDYLTQKFQEIVRKIIKNPLWALAYLFWLDQLFLVRIGPEIQVLSSRKLLLILAFLPLIVYEKFSIAVLVLFLVIVAEIGMVYSLVGEPSEGIFKLVFLLVFAIAARLLAEKYLNGRKKVDF